jgi:ribosome-associated heat shock protein Hsp15
MSEAPRIDKFLWAVRLFKTRTIAADACKTERIKINGKPAKASAILKPGDILLVKQIPIWRQFTVHGFPKNRVAAALVKEFITETTSAEEIEKFEEYKINQRNQFIFNPEKGRPTKKSRRSIDKFKDEG